MALNTSELGCVYEIPTEINEESPYLLRWFPQFHTDQLAGANVCGWHSNS